MPEGSQPGESRPAEEDSSSRLWRGLKSLFLKPEADQSLRAQIEEAIDDHDEGDAASGDLSLVERQMLRNLLHFSEHDADDIAVPRGEIIAIAGSASFDELVAAFAEHGHSRLPVFGDSLDDVIGMIHIKDVFAIIAGKKARPKDWSGLMRQPLFVPQARGALDVLADMRASRMHLAIVLDEYSGTDGLITIEDLVEEIVGNIEDEHDDAPTDLLLLIEDGMWDADARAELEDVGERIDPRLALTDDAVETLGGLAFMLAGNVPPVGTMLEHPSGWRLEVTGGDERRVTRLRLHQPALSGPEE